MSWDTENKERRAFLNKRMWGELRMEALRRYSRGKLRCKRCGENEFVVLQLDHINGNGNQERKRYGLGLAFYLSLRKRGYPPGFQVLCANCNIRKERHGI